MPLPSLKEERPRAPLPEEDLLHKEHLRKEDLLPDSIRIKVMKGITDSPPPDKIHTANNHKGAIPKEEDPNIPIEKGRFRDNLDPNFREGIINRDMKEEDKGIHRNKEEILGPNTRTQEPRTGTQEPQTEGQEINFEEILRVNTTSRGWPRRYPIKEMLSLLKEELPQGRGSHNINKMEKITALTAEGRFMGTPQAVCCADGAGSQMREDNHNMSRRDGNIPAIKIHDIKENLQVEGPLQGGSVMLMIR